MTSLLQSRGREDTHVFTVRPPSNERVGDIFRGRVSLSRDTLAYVRSFSPQDWNITDYSIPLPYPVILLLVMYGLSFMN